MAVVGKVQNNIKFAEKSVLQFLEGLSFLSYTMRIVNFELSGKEFNFFVKRNSHLFPLLRVRSFLDCKVSNKGVLKKNGLLYPYVGLLKEFVQIQHNVPFVCDFFLNTSYAYSNDRRDTITNMHYVFFFKDLMLSLFSFDFFRTILLSKVYRSNQFVVSSIVDLREGLLFQFKFHEVLLRSFFITTSIDENIDQQASFFNFFQLLNEFTVLNQPLNLDLFFQKVRVGFKGLDYKCFFFCFLSFFGFFFSKQFSKQFSNKFFIKLV